MDINEAEEARRIIRKADKATKEYMKELRQAVADELKNTNSFLTVIEDLLKSCEVLHFALRVAGEVDNSKLSRQLKLDMDETEA